MILVQRAPHLAAPEVPPLFRVREVGLVRVRPPQERPHIVVRAFAPQVLQSRKKGRRPAANLFRKLERVFRRFRLRDGLSSLSSAFLGSARFRLVALRLGIGLGFPPMPDGLHKARYSEGACLSEVESSLFLYE